MEKVRKTGRAAGIAELIVTGASFIAMLIYGNSYSTVFFFWILILIPTAVLGVLSTVKSRCIGTIPSLILLVIHTVFHIYGIIISVQTIQLNASFSALLGFDSGFDSSSCVWSIIFSIAAVIASLMAVVLIITFLRLHKKAFPDKFTYGE